MAAATYRKKPVEIQAIQWDGENYGDMRDFTRRADGFSALVDREGDKAAIETLEGVMTASIGDWIIKGVKGEFYPCKPDIFEATYEQV